MLERQLVLISGAVAAGKTTAAEGLAGRARSEGIPAMAIDMDEMTAMVAGRDWSLVSRDQRLLAAQLTGSLVEAAFRSGIRLVAIAGSTLSGYEWDEVTAGLTPGATVTRVLLKVSLAESIRRAQGDPGRVSTRDADYIAKLAEGIDWASVPPADIEVDTDGMTGSEVIDLLAAKVHPPLGSGHRR